MDDASKTLTMKPIIMKAKVNDPVSSNNPLAYRHRQRAFEHAKLLKLWLKHRGLSREEFVDYVQSVVRVRGVRFTMEQFERIEKAERPLASFDSYIHEAMYNVLGLSAETWYAVTRIEKTISTLDYRHGIDFSQHDPANYHIHRFGGLEWPPQVKDAVPTKALKRRPPLLPASVIYRRIDIFIVEDDANSPIIRRGHFVLAVHLLPDEDVYESMYIVFHPKLGICVRELKEVKEQDGKTLYLIGGYNSKLCIEEFYVSKEDILARAVPF